MSSVRKIDAIGKLDGSRQFLDDYSYPDMLHGYIYYSQKDHAIIKSISFPKNFDFSQFVIVFAKDIPGKNIVPEPEQDQLFLAVYEATYYGQPIMGIAHKDKNILQQFVKGIKVEYDELKATTDIKECLENEKNHFGRELTIDHHQESEIAPDWIRQKHVYYTPHQEQAYLEPQGMIAKYDPETKSMFIKGTCQCPYFVKDAVETILGKTVQEVVVETSEGIGGAFGGKEDFPNVIAGITALLSFKSGKAVKIVLDRSDDIQITTKRHPARIEIETFTDPETKEIKKLDIDYRLDAGAFQTLSPVVLSRGVLHSYGGYNIPDVFVQGRLMHSNTPPNGAFRGFGAPQAFSAIEAHIDRIAHKMNQDPYQFRKNNLLRKGDEFPTTQKITEDHLFDCLERAVEISSYQDKLKDFAFWNKKHDNKKGIGIAIGYHGGGYTGNGEKILNSEIKIVIEKDATVKIYVINTDMGQGAHTTLAQMFAEAIGHPFSKTIVQIPNTKKSPDSGPTVASRTIYIIGNLLKKTALALKKEIGFSSLEKYVKENPAEFPKEIHNHFKQDPMVIFDEETYQGIAYKDYSWGVCITEIFFHAETYQIELIKSWNVFDVGRVVNEKIAVGQAEGGILQGLGYGTTEFFYKPGFGRMHGFTDYAMPTTLDLPEMIVEFIHTDETLAKGLGEIPMNFPAASVRNAFHNATGIFIDEYPLTPENVFKNLKSTD